MSYDRFDPKLTFVIIVITILTCAFIFRPIWGFAVLSLIFLLIIINRSIVLYNQKSNFDKQKKELNIVNVEKGGVFKLTGVGENADELTLKVLAKHLYREGDYYWYELECDKGSEEKVFVDVEVDDYVNVSIVLETLKLHEIELSDSLEKIDDEEEGYVKYKQKTFFYTESDSAVFYRFCDDKKSEKFYYWDFEQDNKIISVEKWGKEYAVYYCQKMKPSQITVLSNKGE